MFGDFNKGLPKCLRLSVLLAVLPGYKALVYLIVVAVSSGVDSGSCMKLSPVLSFSWKRALTQHSLSSSHLYRQVVGQLVTQERVYCIVAYRYVV